MECLSNKLMEADHYIAQRLLSSDTKPSNPYAAFFARFKDCHFLTLNYDSLPEIFLFHHKVWCPQDGYGIPVYGELDPLANEDIRAEIRCRQSSSNVLHLHGSLCIYSRSFDLTRQVGNSTLWVVLNKNPDYIFDPDSISDMFFPYKRTPRGPSYQRLEERVVAPVPDKAEGLQGEFIRAVHSRAKGILGSCQRVIVIGYRFNALDKDSYDSLLRALSRAPNPEAVLVCPDADSLKDRLSRAYPRVNWVPHAKTFSAWVEAGFPGAALT
jgi:hypothetical protein